MKANAIVRIVIWSVVILLLAGILFHVIVGERSHTEAVEMPLIEDNTSDLADGTVTEDTPIYNAPSTGSTKIGALSKGEEVQILKQETANGTKWALTNSGWVLMDHILLKSAGPVAVDSDGSVGAVGAEKIRNLEIEWAAGSITILPGTDTETIRFWDDYSGEDKYLLYYEIEGSTLSIQYAKGLDWDSNIGITFTGVTDKNLVIEVPQDWDCEKLEIDAASAKLEVQDLRFQEVEIDTASGAVGFENCTVGTLDVDTASGDLIYSGTLNELDCDSASASIVANLSNTPKSIDLDTASGNLDITLPEDAGFSVTLDSLSGKFRSDFGYAEMGGRYVCGDGGCNITVSAMSGNVYIQKNTQEQTP